MINALLVVTGVLVVLGIVFAEPLVRAVRREHYAAVPGKLELTVQLDADHAAVPDVRRARRGGHGDAELAAPLLHPGAVAGDVQRGDDRLRVRAGAADAARSACQPIAAIAIGTLLGGLAQLALQWPTLRARGLPLSTGARLARPGLRRMLLLMGPGTSAWRPRR